MIGVFSKTTDSSIIEAIGFSNLDFVIIDQEHGNVDFTTTQNHIRAATLTSLKPIVRVAELNHNLIGKALDSGAFGIQVPNIETVSDAKKAIDSAKFYPLGSRGVCRFVRSAEYGSMDKKAYFEKSNKSFLVLQIEGEEGIKNLDEIIQLNGFDVLFIGPYDLSQSLGVPGDIDHPLVREAIVKIKDKCSSRSILMGSFADTYDRVNWLVSLGFEYIAYSVDINIFLEACLKLRMDIKDEY
ncbi:MAG: aldolase [Flavobacteriaceae bacterium]|nr:aldolase [Flavobacteriaceae bacterium]